MSLELLDPESEQLYTKLKSLVVEHAGKVALTFEALVRIRDGRLYRAEFRTFSAFCESVGMNTRKAYRLLEDKKKPKRIEAPKPEPLTKAVRDALHEDDGKAIPTESVNEQPAAVPMVAISGPDAEARVAAMMQKLSLKPVIDVRAEQYRTHTPIPPMDRPEEDVIEGEPARSTAYLPQPVMDRDKELLASAGVRTDKMMKQIASTELKAWAMKRRTMNDTSSEDDAAWADYIAQQILL